MNRNRNEFYRFRGDTPPTEASRASILEPAIEGTVAELEVIRPDDTLEDFMRRRYGLPEADTETAREIGAAPSQPPTSVPKEPA